MKNSLRLFRRIQMLFSIAVFLFVFIICYLTTGFNITEIQLSRWGVTHQVGWLWNGCLIILGMSCYFNISQYIKLHPHLQFKKYFKAAFMFQCLCISLLGVFVAGNIIHGILAYTYFFTLPLMINLMAMFNRNRITVREWLIHTVLSSLMILVPLSTLFIFSGKAISETLHSMFFIMWNLYLLEENKL